MRDSRWSVIPGVLIVLAATAIIAVRFSGEPPIETDILQSLPGGDDDRIVADAIRRAGAAAGSRMTFAVRGKDEKLREAAARDLTRRLTQTGLFTPVVGEGRDIARWLFANRTEILCPADERKLLQGRGNEIAREALVRVYTPGAPISGDLLSRDPFLLSFRLNQCLMPRSPRADVEAAIVAGRLVASPYRLDVQDTIDEAVTGWNAEWADRGVSLDRSGAVFHAHAGAIRARREISIIGGLSTVAIVVLFWVVFRRYRAPVLAVATVLCGIGGGLALVLIAFDRVHIMALVFGSALTGIAVDYAIHFMMTGLAAPGATGAVRRRRVWRPMTVGMATSVCGFSAILPFSTAVMSQVAVFAVGGLIAAWAFSLSVLPAIDESGDPPSRWARALASAAGRILRPRLPGWAYATCAMATVVVVAAGFARLTFLDDVRALQKPPADLKAEEDRIAKLTGFQPSIQFLLSIGKDYDAAKRAEERALALMHAQGGTDASGVVAITRFDPSAERRDRIRALLETALLAPHLRAYSADLGLASKNPDRAYDKGNELGAPARGPERASWCLEWLPLPDRTSRKRRCRPASGTGVVVDAGCSPGRSGRALLAGAGGVPPSCDDRVWRRRGGVRPDRSRRIPEARGATNSAAANPGSDRRDGAAGPGGGSVLLFLGDGVADRPRHGDRFRRFSVGDQGRIGPMDFGGRGVGGIDQHPVDGAARDQHDLSGARVRIDRLHRSGFKYAVLFACQTGRGDGELWGSRWIVMLW